ncbi:MAG TPA: tRNA preQ1(34) S-adenosylmethionine ribosyltransferase-isomerase QueA [Ruminiclostridium sp.]
MNLQDFNYYLPQELIAQHPMEKRDMSRLMVLDKKTGQIEHKGFKDIVDNFNEGDCLVLNNTRVIPARLLGVKEGSGGKIEFVLLKRVKHDDWEVILRPGKKAKPGARFVFGNGELKAEILEVLEEGNRLVRFLYDGVFEEILDRVGIMPLPPYITEKLEDPERYQTVYAKYNGSAAAPTAGLHFTQELLGVLKNKGVRIVNVMLHVGLGTFRPVKVDDITKHKMHSEYFSIDQDACDTINATKKNGKKVVAVGTTSCRVLETVGSNGELTAGDGWTDIFIYPGYQFRIVDSMITNFHLPQSTLIMLISSLAGRDNILNAYSVAVTEKYRFFSFGDAMFIK